MTFNLRVRPSSTGTISGTSDATLSWSASAPLTPTCSARRKVWTRWKPICVNNSAITPSAASVATTGKQRGGNVRRVFQDRPFRAARCRIFLAQQDSREAGQPRVGRGLSAHGHLGEAPAARRRCALLLVQYALRRLQPLGARSIVETGARAIGSPTSPAPCPASSPATSTPFRFHALPHAARSAADHGVFAARRFRAAHPVATRDEGTATFLHRRARRTAHGRIPASSHFQTIDAEIDHTRGSDGYPIGSLPRHRDDATRPRPDCTAAGGDAARIAEGIKKQDTLFIRCPWGIAALLTCPQALCRGVRSPPSPSCRLVSLLPSPVCSSSSRLCQKGGNLAHSRCSSGCCRPGPRP